jgi:hypothetical protein
LWEPLAQLVLDASYEATVLATIQMIANKRVSGIHMTTDQEGKETSDIAGVTCVQCGGDDEDEVKKLESRGSSGGGTESAEEPGLVKTVIQDPHRLFLTFLGGGVFRNEPEWIARAVGRALAVAACTDDAPEIVICHFRKVSENMKNLIDEAYRLELDARKQL